MASLLTLSCMAVAASVVAGVPAASPPVTADPVVTSILRQFDEMETIEAGREVRDEFRICRRGPLPTVRFRIDVETPLKGFFELSGGPAGRWCGTLRTKGTSVSLTVPCVAARVEVERAGVPVWHRRETLGTLRFGAGTLELYGTGVAIPVSAADAPSRSPPPSEFFDELARGGVASTACEGNALYPLVDGPIALVSGKKGQQRSFFRGSFYSNLGAYGTKGNLFWDAPPSPWTLTLQVPKPYRGTIAISAGGRGPFCASFRMAPDAEWVELTGHFAVTTRIRRGHGVVRDEVITASRVAVYPDSVFINDEDRWSSWTWPLQAHAADEWRAPISDASCELSTER
jgi:hypothetical protein